MSEHLVEMIEQSIRHNWEELALTDFNGQSFQYRDVARKIAKLHLLFEHADIKPGDKIALVRPQLRPMGGGIFSHSNLRCGGCADSA